MNKKNLDALVSMCALKEYMGSQINDLEKRIKRIEKSEDVICLMFGLILLMIGLILMVLRIYL